MNDSANETAADRVECRASKDSAVRLFIGAAALVAVGLYCVHDGYFAMKRNEAGEMVAKYPPPAAWDLEHINPASTYALNRFGPFLFIPLGILLAVLAIRTLKRFIVADRDGLVVNGRPKIAWSEFTGIDASLLDSKGILTLKRGGDKRGVKLDRYHYRDFRDAVAFIEDRVKVDG